MDNFTGKKIEFMAIINTSSSAIASKVAAQKEFFRSGKTLDIEYRISALKRLRAALDKWQKPIAEALWRDLHKSYEEAYLTELSIVLSEIDNHIRHLKEWASPKRCSTPLKMFPSSSKIISEPLGCSLIIAPWNYPVQLLLNPLVGAISAGCTAMLKPSPYVENVSTVIEQLIAETFDEEYIAVVQGNRDVNTALLEERYDIIFFTGSPSLGRMVMAAAAKNLTPVVLELGGKSPCIVDRDAKLSTVARRIAWGKSLNAGQTCIAPDYLLVHEDIKNELIASLAREFKALLGDNPRESRYFVRIVNDKAFDRLVGYIQGADVVVGGEYDKAERYISPTVIDNVDPQSPIMQEEIFGPIFPIVTFSDINEAVRFVNEREKPLALYFFGDKKSAQYVLRHTSSGGACVNDTIMHIANERMPFGGVGNSGMSSYHGRESFKVFSHSRAVVTTPAWLDVPFRYMPYKMFSLVKKLL